MPFILVLAVWSLKASLLLFVGFLALAMLRNRSGAVRNLVCRGLLLAVISMPLWMAAGEFGGSRSQAPVLVAPVQWRMADPTVSSRRPVTHDEVIPPTDVTQRPKPFPWLAVLAVTYAVGLGVTVFRFGVHGLAARRAVTCSLSYGGERHGLPRWLPIRVTNRISVPATLGYRHPVVLLPIEAVEWSEAARGAALAHEWAHVRRADWLWQTVATALACIHWFNPLLWVVRDVLRQSAEIAADDLAIHDGFDSAAYVRELLEIASGCIVAPSGAVAMARRVGFKARVKRLLDGRRDRTVPGRGWRIGTSFAMAVPAIALGGAFEHGLTPDQGVARFSDGPAEYGPSRLPNGEEIRLDYVQDFDSYPNRIWRPDGSPVSLEVKGQSIHVGPGPRAHGSDVYYRTFKFTKSGGRSFDWVIRVPFATYQAVYQTWGDSDGRMVDMAGVTMGHPFKEIDLKVGVPYGPWRRYATEGLVGARLNAQIVTINWDGWWNQHCGQLGPVVGETEAAVEQLPVWPNVVKPENNVFRGASIVPSSTETVVETDRDVQIEYTIPEELKDCELYLEAFEGNRQIGIQRFQIDCSGAGGFVNNRRSVVFVGNPAKITRVELIGRPYGWATFRGVKTEPS